MLTPKKMYKKHLALGLLKYHRKFEGVLLAYNKVKVQMRGQIQWDLTHIVTHYTFEGLIFRPKIGDILTGRVDNLNKNHLGFLHLLILVILNVIFRLYLQYIIVNDDINQMADMRCKLSVRPYFDFSPFLIGIIFSYREEEEKRIAIIIDYCYCE